MTDQPTAVTKPVNEWIAQLKDSKAGRREAALGILGGLEDPAAVDPILELLAQETNENVRLAAIRALGSIGAARAASPLSAHLPKETSPAMRQAVMFALGRLRQLESIPLLAKALLEENDYEVRYGAVEALTHFSDPAAVEALVTGLGARLSENLRGRIVTALGSMKAQAASAVIERTLFEDREESVRRAAAKALTAILGEEAVPALGGALLKERDPKVVLRIVEQLGQLGVDAAAGPLAAALLDARQPDLRAALKAALLRIPNWRVKFERFTALLQAGSYEREDLPAYDLVDSIGVPAAELQKDPHLLTDLFLEQSVGKDKRLVDIYAALVTASAGNDQDEAGERINRFQEKRGLSDAQLDGLRIRVGGDTALDPMLEILSDDLRLYFREPIKRLNEDTQANWQNTVRSAQFGFMARMILSIIVFGVGILLFLVSSYRFMFAQLDAQQMFGNGVSFVSGLGTLLLIIYTGPLKEIRAAVNDLGTSSAAFIAYVHRVLQVSHTYSFFYLKQKITFEEMAKSGKLIEDAMNDTIGRLNRPQGRGSESVIQKALSGLKKDE